MDQSISKREDDFLDKYSLIFEKMINGCALHKIVLDADGKPVDYVFVDINQAFEEMTGLKKVEILGRKVTEVIPGTETDPAGWIAKYGEVALTGKDVQFENFSQGLNKWFKISAYSPKNQYFITITEDITDKKFAEKAALESSIFLKEILDAIPVRVFWKDLNSNYLGCNKSFANDAGFQNISEVIGKDDYQMGWKDQADLYRSDDKKVIESGISKFNIEEPQTTPDGKNITLLTSKLPMINADGKTLGVIGVYMDITEHKLAEERLKFEQNLTQSLIDSIPGAFYAINEKGKYLRWNSYQQNVIAGKTAAEMPETSAVDTIHPDDRQEVFERIMNVIDKGTSELVEGRVLLHGGPEFVWLLMSGKQTILNGEKILVGIGMDISDRKKVEEDYNKSKMELEAKVKELETFTKLTINRELKMIELKNKIKEVQKA